MPTLPTLASYPGTGGSVLGVRLSPYMPFIHSMWQDAALVDHLIESYPDYIKIKELLSGRGGNREKVQTCTRITCVTGGTLSVVHAVMDLYKA